MVLRTLMRCMVGPRLKSMECLVWVMSATAVIFLVYSLGKLQSQYLIENSVMVNPDDGAGHRVLSLVKLYEKAGPNLGETKPNDKPMEMDSALGDDQGFGAFQRKRRDSRLRKLLKDAAGFVPLGERGEEGATIELDELDGYNYFMVSEEEAEVKRQMEEQEAARRARHAQKKLNSGADSYHVLPPGGSSRASKKNGWFDRPPNVEFHNELKQDFKEYNAKNNVISNSNKHNVGDALKQGEESDNGLKFLYIDEHGNKVYGPSFKKPQFEPLQININRGAGVAQFNQDNNQDNHQDNHQAGAGKLSNNDIVRQYVELSLKRRKAEKERAPFKTLHMYVTANGRFGNNLFQYAALYGLSRATNRIPILPTGTELAEVFIKSRFSIAEGTVPRSVKMVHETNSGIYSPNLYTLPQEDVLVCCYLQSWKYFNNYKTMINHLFRFKRPIRERAAVLLEDAKDVYLRKNPAVSNGAYTPKLTYIGTHIRRGDYMLKEHLARGYRPAPLSYINKAMDYYRSKYAHTVFVVTSDDLSWSVQHLNFSDVAFVSGPDHGVDLAALSLCNHTIMTVGTYGWWAGWLAGGEVVYYRDWIAPGSDLAIKYNPQDYFLPDWRPIGDL